MKYLTIIRHAKSSWENPDIDDIARPLNERGLQSIKIIGKYLEAKDIRPDLILISPATRAMQTAVGIGELVNCPAEISQIKQEIYFGNPTSVLSLIKKTDNKFNDVFLFGHEPTLSSLIELLTKKRIDKFPTCAVYRIAIDIINWNSISSGKEVFFVYPKLFTEE